MTDITIPPEAAKALAMAILEMTGEGIDMEEARAACLAMLKAWPGAEWLYVSEPVLALPMPLTQENTIDKG